MKKTKGKHSSSFRSGDFAFVVKCDLASYRNSLGMTQSQLADYVGVSVNTISAIETGHSLPSVPLAYALSIALDIRMDSLFYLHSIGSAAR